MLSEWVYSFPIFFFALFATVQVSEIGYFVSASDLASFYAARANFVAEGDNKMTEKAVREIFEITRNPFSFFGDKIDEKEIPKPRYLEINSHLAVKVTLRQAPYLEDLFFGLEPFQNLDLGSVMLIPEKGGDE